MCLAIPAEVVELLPGDMGRVNVDGVEKEISLGLLEGIAVGDYVLVHVGFALSKIDEEEAKLTLKMLHEMGEMADFHVSEIAG